MLANHTISDRNNVSTRASESNQNLHNFRVSSLWVLTVLGLSGSSLMWYWLCYRRRHSTRIVRLFRHLAAADVLVNLCTTCPLLVLEYTGNEWRFGGDIFCRVFMYLMGFSICASNYLIIPIALDRCKVVLRPLSPLWKVRKLTVTTWVLSGIISLPSILIFRQMEHNGKILCRNILYDWPLTYLRLCLTAAVLLVYVGPLLLVIVCNIQVFLKIGRAVHLSSSEENEEESQINCFESRAGRVRSSSFQEAQVKTLKLTFAVIGIFLVCEAPFCVLELWRVYGDHNSIEDPQYSILPILAVLNSSINPYVFLFLHANISFPRKVTRRSAVAIVQWTECRREENLRKGSTQMTPAEV
ncbi:oxytocin receptor-like [Tachypleus tridentatus]|uniref:oxytocin receptor-like n=1 Tax=Tachypleus tridentatus TaxID=6853 RepID=UPI003FD1C5D5